MKSNKEFLRMSRTKLPRGGDLYGRRVCRILSDQGDREGRPYAERKNPGRPKSSGAVSNID